MVNFIQIIFNYITMILNIFKKYTDRSKRIKIVKTIIENLNINERQKNLYLDSLEFLDEDWLDKLYKSLEKFMGEVEKEQSSNNKNDNLVKMEWLRKKEAIEKQKEINSFWFLLNNL